MPYPDGLVMKNGVKTKRRMTGVTVGTPAQLSSFGGGARRAEEDVRTRYDALSELTGICITFNS
jgi:hypothetical protein